MTRQGKKRRSNPTLSNAMDGLKFILLQLKNCMMEISCCLEGESTTIGHPTAATRVGVGIIYLHGSIQTLTTVGREPWSSGLVGFTMC